MRKCFLLFLICFTIRAWALPDVPEEAKKELGSTYGVPQMDGFVFIEGKYIAPPYSVSRKGNGIFINRIQIAQPVAWTAVGGSVPEPPPQPSVKKATDGDFEEVEEPPAPAPAADAPAEKPDGENNEVVDEQAAPAENKESDTVKKKIDDLFADDEDEPAAPPAPKAGLPRAPATPQEGKVAKVTAPVSVADAPAKKAELRQNLDKLRLHYENSLKQNNFFFFSESHSVISGNSGSSRTLIYALPSALRSARSAEDLLARLQRQGVYFLDLPTAVQLFRNRLSFPQLEQRLETVKQKEASEAAARRAKRGY